MMNKRIEKLDEEWQREQQSYYYHRKFRTLEAVKQYWDRESDDYDVRMFQDSRRIDAIVDLLKSKDLLSGKTILETGCGTGLYAMALARCCAKVTALDLSEKMGSVLLEKARKSHIRNIMFKQCDWTEIDIRKAGLYKANDVSLSALNPAMNSATAIMKLIDTAKQACCIITFASRPQNEVRDFFENMFLTNASKEGTIRRDGLYIYGILTEMGYYPEISYVQMDWVKEHDRKQAVERLVHEYSPLCPDRGTLKTVIEGYVDKHIDTYGMFKEYNHSRLSVLYWMT